MCILENKKDSIFLCFIQINDEIIRNGIAPLLPSKSNFRIFSKISHFGRIINLNYIVIETTDAEIAPFLSEISFFKIKEEELSFLRFVEVFQINECFIFN